MRIKIIKIKIVQTFHLAWANGLGEDFKSIVFILRIFLECSRNPSSLDASCASPRGRDREPRPPRGRFAAPASSDERGMELRG